MSIRSGDTLGKLAATLAVGLSLSLLPAGCGGNDSYPTVKVDKEVVRQRLAEEDKDLQAAKGKLKTSRSEGRNIKNRVMNNNIGD